LDQQLPPSDPSLVTLPALLPAFDLFLFFFFLVLPAFEPALLRVCGPAGLAEALNLSRTASVGGDHSGGGSRLSS
jgi:hypothetical protein